jgi:hypothetical protein
VVRHPIELGSVPMDRRPPGVSALLGHGPGGRLDRVGQQQKADQQESTFSFLKTRSVL